MNVGPYRCPRCENDYRTGEAMELHLREEHNLALFQASWGDGVREIKEREAFLPGLRKV